MATDEGTAKKESQITAQCSYLERSLGELSKVVDDLEARLSNVLRESAPEESCDEKAAESLVEHAECIRQFGDKTKREFHRIQDMLGRLEL